MADANIFPGQLSGLPLRVIDNSDGTYSQAVATPSGNPLSVNPARGSKTFFTAAPTTGATLLLAANSNRKYARLTNNSAFTVFVGKDTSVTTSNGVPMLTTATLEDRDSTDAWYGITASLTGDIRGYEVA